MARIFTHQNTRTRDSGQNILQMVLHELPGDPRSNWLASMTCFPMLARVFIPNSGEFFPPRPAWIHHGGTEVKQGRFGAAFRSTQQISTPATPPCLRGAGLFFDLERRVSLSDPFIPRFR